MFCSSYKELGNKAFIVRHTQMQGSVENEETVVVIGLKSCDKPVPGDETLLSTLQYHDNPPQQLNQSKIQNLAS